MIESPLAVSLGFIGPASEGDPQDLNGEVGLQSPPAVAGRGTTET